MKGTYQLLLYTIIAIFLSSCGNDAHRKIYSKTIIEGHINDHKQYSASKFITLEGHKSMNHSQFPEYLIDEHGNFRIELDLDEPKVLALKPFNRFYVYVFPGDSIYIDTYLGKRNNTQFSGRYSIDQRKMNAYYNEGFQVNLIGDNNEKYTTILEQSKETFAINHAAKNEFIKKYNPENNLIEFINSDIKTNIYHSLFSYGFSACSDLNANLPLEKSIEAKQKYFTFIDDFKGDIEELKINPKFDIQIHGYFRYLGNLYQAYEMSEFGCEKITSSQLEKLISIVVENESNTMLKSYLLSAIANKFLEEDSIHLFNKYEDVFLQHISQEKILLDLTRKRDMIEKPALDQYTLRWYPIDILLSMESEYFQNILSSSSDIIWFTIFSTGCPGSKVDVLESQSFIQNTTLPVEFEYIVFGDQQKFAEFYEKFNPAGRFTFLPGDETECIGKNLQVHRAPYHILIDKKRGFIKMDYGASLKSKSTQNLIQLLETYNEDQRDHPN